MDVITKKDEDHQKKKEFLKNVMKEEGKNVSHNIM